MCTLKADFPVAPQGTVVRDRLISGKGTMRRAFLLAAPPSHKPKDLCCGGRTFTPVVGEEHLSCVLSDVFVDLMHERELCDTRHRQMASNPVGWLRREK